MKKISDCMTAWYAWTDFWQKEKGSAYQGIYDSDGNYDNFDVFMGGNPFTYTRAKAEMPPEMERKLELLCSPHSHAILKAYRVVYAK